MKSWIVLFALFTSALAGATAEGLWHGMPVVLVQLNGAIMLITAVALTALAAQVLRDKWLRRQTRLGSMGA